MCNFLDFESEVNKVYVAIIACSLCVALLFLAVNKLCKRIEVLEKKLGINKPEKKDLTK